MRRSLAVPLLLTLIAPLPAAAAADASGRWEGAIQIPGGELAIAVTLTPGDGGSWTGSIDIPAQGLHGFELSETAVDGGRVHFEMAGVPGRPWPPRLRISSWWGTGPSPVRP